MNLFVQQSLTHSLTNVFFCVCLSLFYEKNMFMFDAFNFQFVSHSVMDVTVFWLITLECIFPHKLFFKYRIYVLILKTSFMATYFSSNVVFVP